MALTVLTYAAFTGLSFFAATWWQLLIFRFLAALGIGVYGAYLAAFPSATVRYRLTLEADVDGKVVTGSGVIEVTRQDTTIIPALGGTERRVRETLWEEQEFYQVYWFACRHFCYGF